MVHLYKDSFHSFLAFWLRLSVAQRFIAIGEASQLFSSSGGNFMEFYFCSLSLSFPLSLIFLGLPCMSFELDDLPIGFHSLWIPKVIWGALFSHYLWVSPSRLWICNGQELRVFLANPHPLAPNPQLCHCYQTWCPALIPSCIPLHLCQPWSPKSSLSLWTLISTWPHMSLFWLCISLLPNFWNPSTVTSQYPLYTSLLWMFTSCYTGDMVLARTLVLLQVLAIFSPTLLV